MMTKLFLKDTSFGISKFGLNRNDDSSVKSSAVRDKKELLDQVLQLVVERSNGSFTLEKFALESCANFIAVALKTNWLELIPTQNYIDQIEEVFFRAGEPHLVLIGRADLTQDSRY